MKYTLLEMTQLILSSLDADAVNSIFDTEESSQVVSILKTTYLDIIDKMEVDEHNSVFNLVASTDVTQPTLMTIPDAIANIEQIRYNKTTLTDTEANYQPVLPLSFSDFCDRMYSFNTSDSNVFSFTYTTGEGMTLLVLGLNDRAPTYYTSFDDHTVLFDTYDVAVDSTLQSSKTMVTGRRTTTWTDSDVFVAPFSDKHFSVWLNESKSLAFAEMKQITHAIADRNARRGWVTLNHNKSKVQLKSEFEKLPNFGRK